MSSARPVNNRTYSTHSVTEVLESPTLSATSSILSTPSAIEGDQDPMQSSLGEITAAECKREDGSASDVYERGRTPTQSFEKYEVDPRSMSPRRNSEELDRLSAETKARLEQWVSRHWCGDLL